MNHKQLIQNAYQYYDKYNEQYEQITKKVDNYVISNKSSDLKISEISYFDYNKKSLFTGKIQSIGTYFIDTKLWVWTWNHPYREKNQTYFCINLGGIIYKCNCSIS